MEQQHTIERPVSLQGRGLFYGRHATVTFKPAPANHGVVFERTDLGGVRVPALVHYVIKRPRRTALRRDEAVIEVCEHLLSAVAAKRIDNLLIEIDDAEVPGLDGSAQPFYEALDKAGVAENDAPRQQLVVHEPVVVRHGDSMIAATPAADDEMQVVYELDYSSVAPAIGRQLRVFDLQRGDYANEIAPSRTYALESEALALQKMGVGTHLSVDTALVIGKNGPLGANALRFDDEPVRHKVLDLIGDLYLLGAPIRGRVVAYKSGHGLNHLLVRKLVDQHKGQRLTHLAHTQQVMDIRRLFRMMPHRYPMLLVDRVVELDGDRRAVGVKNVTINEPYFTGHYPGTPIMPGVLVVEAMAQLSGVLIGQSLEQVGKLPILLSLDRVKLRRPVVPGDQLMLEAESVRIRSRIAHMRCRAYVAEEVAAEAEVRFMLVDDDQE
mgnify:CR=1 FL=1